MAIFWNLVCEQYFQAVSKDHFGFLHEEYQSRCQNERSSLSLNLDSELAMRSFFLERLNPEWLSKLSTNEKPRIDVWLLHFRLACKLYLPILSINPFIDETFLSRFQECWTDKSRSVVRHEEGTQGLKKEHDLLNRLLDQQTQRLGNKGVHFDQAGRMLQNGVDVPAKTGGKYPKSLGVKSKPTAVTKDTETLDSLIQQLESELVVCQTQKETSIKNLASDLVSAYENLEPDFRSEYCANKRAMQSEDETLGSVFAKREYLFKEILRLEEIQIAESIMFVEEFNTPGSSNPARSYRIQFDETLLNIEMDLSEQELLKMNKLREYSLFGIHRAGPNNPYSYFSFSKELNEICQRPGFQYTHKMSYNYEPQMVRDMKKAAGKVIKPTKVIASSEETSMCHHCKTLLPRSKFFQCGKKCKRSQTEPCKCFLTSGDFLRKRAMGSRIKTPPGCNKIYCLNCLNGWYGMDSETKVSCPACQKICFCTRCNRFENLERFVQILERLDGDIDTLVINSPASKLAHRLLYLYPDLLNNTSLESDENSRRLAITKESLAKSSLKGEPYSQVLMLHNQRYKQAHTLKLLARQLLVRLLSTRKGRQRSSGRK